MIHVISYYAEYDNEWGAHELEGTQYTCSFRCMAEILLAMRNGRVSPAIDDDHKGLLVWYSAGPFSPLVIEYGAWPCGSETDYDVHCANCGVQLWEGLERG